MKIIGYCVFGLEQEVPLLDYAGASKLDVFRKIEDRMRYEKFSGSVQQRLHQLGWVIWPLALGLPVIEATLYPDTQESLLLNRVHEIMTRIEKPPHVVRRNRVMKGTTMNDATLPAATFIGNKSGSDITLTAGKGLIDHSNDGPPIDGSIKFNLPHGEEVMRIEPNGYFFVKGRLVCNDYEAHQGFVNWLRSAGFHL